MDWNVLQGLAAAAALLSTPAGAGQTPLARCIAAQAEKLDFSGVVWIAQPGGTTSYARGGSLTTESRFNLASASKMFTAVAVAQLADAGKVRLSDPIGQYVKGLTPEASAVTLRQLLTHSSGLGNFFSPENLPALKRARSLSDLVPLVAADKPAFSPGSRFQYSNTGFLLLGLLVEHASGLSFGDYLQRNVFGPAQMLNTGLDPLPSRAQAVGMTAMPEHPTPPLGGSPGAGATALGPLRPAPEASLRGTPAGGLYSTAPDLQRFFTALLGGTLTSKATLEEFLSPQASAPPPKEGMPPLRYGLGFGMGEAEGHPWIGHGGGAPGVNVELAAFADEGITFIVLSNRDPPSASMLFRTLRAAVFKNEALSACLEGAPP